MHSRRRLQRVVQLTELRVSKGAGLTESMSLPRIRICSIIICEFKLQMSPYAGMHTDVTIFTCSAEDR